jgi:hypothetical protein
MPDDSDKPLTVLTTMLKPMRGPDEWERQLVERDIPTKDLKNALELFINQMRWISENALARGRTAPGFGVDNPPDPKTADQTEEFLLDEMSFHAEVSPEGEFKLVGAGGQPAGSGVSFVWRRKHVFGTADLHKSLDSSVVQDGQHKNELRVALVGPSFNDDTVPLQVKTEIVNVVRTSIQDFVNVILVGV